MGDQKWTRLYSSSYQTVGFTVVVTFTEYNFCGKMFKEFLNNNSEFIK